MLKDLLVQYNTSPSPPCPYFNISGKSKASAATTRLVMEGGEQPSPPQPAGQKKSGLSIAIPSPEELEELKKKAKEARSVVNLPTTPDNSNQFKSPFFQSASSLPRSASDPNLSANGSKTRSSFAPNALLAKPVIMPITPSLPKITATTITTTTTTVKPPSNSTPKSVSPNSVTGSVSMPASTCILVSNGQRGNRVLQVKCCAKHL